MAIVTVGDEEIEGFQLFPLLSLRSLVLGEVSFLVTSKSTERPSGEEPRPLANGHVNEAP